jgi:hypothetical protein
MTPGPYADVSPSDAAVTLRSLPRRYRSVLRPIDDPQVEEWAERAGPAGTSALDHLVQASRGITMLHRALRQVLNAPEPPILPPAVLDESAREWDHGPVPGGSTTVDAELDLLAEEAEAMATTIADAPGEAWTHIAAVAGAGTEVTALEVAQEAVRTGVTHLKAARQAFDAARP